MAGKRISDPAVRAKMSAASKAAWADPAVRAKISEGLQRSGNALCARDLALLLDMIRGGATALEVSIEFLLSEGYYRLAMKHGVRFLKKSEREHLRAAENRR